jgi:protease-4
MGPIRRAAWALAAVAACLAVPAFGQARRVGLIEIEGSPLARPHELAWLLGSGRPTLRELVDAIKDAGRSDKVDLLAIRLKDIELDRAQVQEIGAAIKAAREAGKRTIVFAESYGPMEFLIGSYADQALIQAGGAAALPGLFMQELYLADTLAWVGLKADMVQIGDYKGASEPLVNAAPSPAWDQNINQLLDGLYANMRRDLKAGRHLDDADLDKALQTLWLADADEAVSSGLVDAAVDLPALGAFLATGKPDAKPDPKAVTWVNIPVGAAADVKVDQSSPFAAMTALMSLFSRKPPSAPSGPSIAIVHIDGTIVDGDSSAGGLLGGASVGSRTIRNALEDIRTQPKIKGVIVRIDSPGGSAIASEIIWKGLRDVAAEKPVWVSVGNMAASGGYYIAAAGQKIYVNPSSIVGSIGVVGGKLAMGGLLESLKVRSVSRGRGPMASMFDSAEPWTPEQLALVRAKMQRTYDLFTRRVSQGRPGIELSRTAEGRLFTGDRAVALKMADRLGGLDAAIQELAETLQLKDFQVLDYPAPRSLEEVLQDLLGGLARAPGMRSGALADLTLALREVIGPRDWPTVAASLRGILEFRRERVLLITPRALLIR